MRDAASTSEYQNGRGLVASIIADAQRLVTLEIALARQEAKELVQANAIAAGLLAFAGLLIAIALLVALPIAVVEAVPWHWQAALVWAAVYAVLGLLLIALGRSRLRIGPPPRTIASLKENKDWALRRVRSNGK